MFTLTFRTSVDAIAWAFLLWMFARTVMFYFVPSKKPLLRYQHPGKTYAVILCFESEIAYALVQELITNGFAIMFITSDADKLGAVVERLKSGSPVAVVEVISVDTSSRNTDELAVDLESVMEQPVTVLVNCLNGLNAQTRYQTFLSNSASDVDDVIDHGIRFTSQVLRLLTPTLIRNGPSIILHVLSETVVGYPYMSTYSGVQGFAMSHAAATKREAKAEGWQLDSIAAVIGDLHARGVDNDYAQYFAKLLLERVEMAVDRGMMVFRPYWVDALQHKLFEALPEPMLQKLFHMKPKRPSAASLKSE